MKNVNRVGEEHPTNEGYRATITKYFGWDNCTVALDDVRNTVIFNVKYQHLKTGKVKNPYHPSVLGVGYVGEGAYKTWSDGMHSTSYIKWRDMLSRCYSEKYKKSRPTYENCSVDERWFNFQVFAEWFEKYYKDGLDLDKDIRVKGNKVYSPETCCFVPTEVNSLLVKRDVSRGKYPLGIHKQMSKYIVSLSRDGVQVYLGVYNTIEEAFQVYKINKESHIRSIAERWRSSIEPEVYQALCAWTIKITD